MRILAVMRRLVGGGSRHERRQGSADFADPFMHPDVRRMTARQLADLPLVRAANRHADRQ
jgi:hypothetical protein